MATTNIKYRLQFNSLLGATWRLDIINVNNAYDDSIYPKALKGTENPVTITVADDDESVYTAFRGKSIDVELLNNGTFTVEEFAIADERTWFFKLYKNAALDFQGWLLPDQISDLYQDVITNPPVTLTATDGLGSLKGILYGLSDVDPQAVIIPDYGLNPITQVFKTVFQAFGYDYGDTVLLSSLRFTDNVTAPYVPSQWLNTSVWNDLFYDENGIPVDAYTAFEMILKSMLLSITQEQGRFKIYHPNDVCYTLDAFSNEILLESAILFNPDFTIQSQGPIPASLKQGFDYPIKPIRPTQNWTFDNAYGQIKATIDFNTLALLYPNPSFEIAPTPGGIPVGLEKIGNASIGLYNAGLEAYDGEWTLRVGTTGDNAYDERSYFRTAEPQYQIEANKKVNISFAWRPVDFSTPDKINPVPAWSLILIGKSGQVYIFNTNNLFDYGPNSANTWVIPKDDKYRQYAQQEITDFTAYNIYNINTTVIPEAGKIEFRIYGALIYNYVNETQKQIYYTRTTDDPIINPPGLANDWDDLQITFDDATDAYSHQVGEVHMVYNQTQFAKSETQEPDFSLYTSPTNKRYAGNVIYGKDVDTGIVNNQEWLFKLSQQTDSKGGRLPEIMVRQMAKMYQKPARIWEGSVLSDDVLMYAVWQIKFFESSQFMCLHYTHDVKNSSIDVVLREITDADFYFQYLYKPKFEKNVRKVN